MLSKLFDVFSRREGVLENQEHKPLSPEFRNRVIMLLQDELQYSFDEFLEALHRKVSYLHGKFRLTERRNYGSNREDLIQYLLVCNDEYFLDIIELVFRSDLPGISWPDNSLIPSINQFFRIDDLPYHLTDYSVQETEEEIFGESRTSISITEYPRVIRRESELIHKNAITPALRILGSVEFKNANNEFLKALEDHRKGDFGDCLTKCGSSLESVMKVLCKKNSIPSKETDNASALLKALLREGRLETYWEQPLILIATLRNRLSSAHGAGTKQKEIPEHIATYAVNATASAILLLCSEFL